jgi:hypothetical protein
MAVAARLTRFFFLSVNQLSISAPVPYDKINNLIAPDGGAHVCAPSK